MPVSCQEFWFHFTCDWFKRKCRLTKYKQTIVAKEQKYIDWIGIALYPNILSVSQLFIIFLSVNQRLIIFLSVNQRFIVFLSVSQLFIIFLSVNQRFFNFSKCKQALIFYSGCRPALIFYSSKYETVSNFCFKTMSYFFIISWIIWICFKCYSNYVQNF